jgi:hypothetical protein
LVAKNPFSLSVIADCVGILTATFYRWYKEFLSDFRTEKEQHKLHKYDISVKKNFRDKEIKIRVPILKIENMGESMAIDEKHINNTFYTVLTNGITGKVARAFAFNLVILILCKHRYQRLSGVFCF